MIIYQMLTKDENTGMEIYEVRLQNLIKQMGDIDEHGRVAEFCREHDLNDSQIRQYFIGVRNIGEKAARNLEKKIGLPTMTLDGAHRSLSLDESRLIDLFRQGSRQGRQLVMGVAESVPKDESKPAPPRA